MPTFSNGESGSSVRTKINDAITKADDALLASNDLSDLDSAATARTNLGLGTAATTAASDYATAAQGALADSAVQPNDSPSFGSITVSGTVDGRDVATDGTKLDGIAAGATNYDNDDVDTHLNTSTATTDQILSWDGSDYDWIDASSGAKAWVNFNGSGTVSIRDDGNVSSITDNGTGDYTVNYSNNVASANYSVSLSATDDGTTAGQTDGFSYGSWARGSNSVGYNVASMRFQIGYPALATLYDQTHINVVITL